MSFIEVPLVDGSRVTINTRYIQSALPDKDNPQHTRIFCHEGDGSFWRVAMTFDEVNRLLAQAGG